jgi:RNA polymerase sigma factor (sigma-70 family)
MAEQREDLVQSACLRIVKKSTGSKESEPLGSSYLWKVAHSVVMDEIRHRRRRPEAELDSPGIAEPVSPAVAPAENLAASQVRDAINQGVMQLTEARRWAVLLYLYGFTLKESARMLGWNPKRVDNQRYKGLTELRSYLRERGHQP